MRSAVVMAKKNIELKVGADVTAIDRAATVYCFQSGRLIATDSLNQSADHLTGRKLLDNGVSPTPEQAADSAFDLASLLA